MEWAADVALRAKHARAYATIQAKTAILHHWRSDLTRCRQKIDKLEEMISDRITA
jgi:hypothetical protein